MKKGRYWTAILLALCLLAVNALTTDPPQNPNSKLIGKIIKVADGDTVTLIDANGLKHKIRLLGIDAPELQQAHGQTAKRWLSDQALNQNLQVEVTDTDRYGRKVGKLLAQEKNCESKECPYHVDLNLKLIELGHAWWYELYQNNQPTNDRILYKNAQAQAQQSQTGLWENKEPIAPWEWRQQQRELRGK